jgi:glycine/D-amino acid oxidase-like deaminating enzyme
MTSLWLDEPHVPRPALGEDATCDVCVVGGGIGGVSVAWRLAGRGLDVVLLEADVIAGGASGRNGGFFLAGQAPSHDKARALWGPEAARTRYAATVAAQQEMLETAEAVGAREHFRVEGLLRLGVGPDDVASVRAHRAALAEDGFPGELLEEDDLPVAVRRPGRVGVLTPNDGSVHPVRWIRALAAAAERERSVRIFEGTRVVSPPGGGVADTARAAVRAGAIVVAADGALPTLVPAAAGVRARRLNMLATAPHAEAVLPWPVYARDGYEYAQQLPDGRVTLGGFSDLDGDASWTDRLEVSAPVQERLEQYLQEDLGVTAPVTHRWSGIVGYAPDPLPRVGPVEDGLWAMGAYNGTGHVQAWVCARILSELIVDGASADAGLFAPVSG